QGVHPNRARFGHARARPEAEVAARTCSANAGNQSARRVRGGGRSGGQRKARSVGRRRGRDQHSFSPPRARRAVADYAEPACLPISSPRKFTSSGFTWSACVQVMQCGPSFTTNRRAPLISLAVRSPEALI